MGSTLDVLSCPECNKPHVLFLPKGDFVMLRRYEYECPETKTRTSAVSNIACNVDIKSQPGGSLAAKELVR